MNHPLVDRLERTGQPFIYKSPQTRLCSCGCGELVVTSYSFCKYDGEMFIDKFHVIDYLSKEGLYEEIE